MRTYLVQIQTDSGIQQIQLIAKNISDVKKQIDARLNRTKDESVSYTIQEQLSFQTPDVNVALLNASSGLFGCIFLLIAAKYQLRRYFR